MPLFVNKDKLVQDVKKRKEELVKTTVPAIKKELDNLKAKASTAQGVDKIAANAELKYAQARYNAAKAGVPIKEEVIDETTGQVKSFAKQSGKSVKEVEAMWNDTVEKIKKQYPKKKEKDIWTIVVSVLKKRLKLVDEDGSPAITTTSIGSPTTVDGTPAMGGNSAYFYGKGLGTKEPVKRTMPKLISLKDYGKPKKKKLREYIDYIDNMTKFI